MKNLANCKPSEFLKQANRIKKSVEKWLTETDILAIRKKMPDLLQLSDDMSDKEHDRITKENRKRMERQAYDNLSEMLDVVLDEHPDETLELLALLCFVEPENVDDYPVSDYMVSIAEMITNEAVIGFFTSLVRLGQIASPNA